MSQFANFAHGPYTASLNATSVGLTAGPIRLTETHHAEPIRADQWGNATLDAIHLGQDVFVALILKEWTTHAQNVIFQLNGGTGGVSGVVGRAYGNIAQQLVLTAVASTPAATLGPATITFPQAILAPGLNKEILFGNVQRDVPLIFQILPNVSGTQLVYWTST